MICHLDTSLISSPTPCLDYCNHTNLLAIAVIKQARHAPNSGFCTHLLSAWNTSPSIHTLTPFSASNLCSMSPSFLTIFADYPLHPSFLAIAFTTTDMFYLIICLSIFKPPYVMSMRAGDFIYFVLSDSRYLHHWLARSISWKQELMRTDVLATTVELYSFQEIWPHN